MPNPLLQQRKPINPQSALWVIFTILVAVCLWLLFERLSPVTQSQFDTVEEVQEDAQSPTDETPSGGTPGPTGVNSTSTNTDQLEKDLNVLNEDLDFSDSDF